MKREEKDIINLTLISIVEFYINLLDTNNNCFIQQFLSSECYSNFIIFNQEEILKPFYNNLFYVIFQTISKPSPKLELLETFFSEEKIYNFFNMTIINYDADMAFRLNLLMIFEVVVKEVKKIFTSDNVEEFITLYPNFLSYLNDLSEKKITN